MGRLGVRWQVGVGKAWAELARTGKSRWLGVNEAGMGLGWSARVGRGRIEMGCDVGDEARQGGETRSGWRSRGRGVLGGSGQGRFVGADKGRVAESRQVGSGRERVGRGWVGPGSREWRRAEGREEAGRAGEDWREQTWREMSSRVRLGQGRGGKSGRVGVTRVA
jgi:hypothetical protein